ncbi:hypothetical protein RI054_10g52950 [Pseudoscourfieldia marina]
MATTTTTTTATRKLGGVHGARVRVLGKRAPQSRRLSLVRAADDGDSKATTTTTTSSSSSSFDVVDSERIKAERAPNEYDFTEVERLADGGELRDGQLTAIITGVLSLAMGLGYLAVVSALDGRGASMQPPPPEALGL